MKQETDKTTQILKSQYDALGEILTDTNKRELREARRRIKHTIHKRSRNLGKRDLHRQLHSLEE